MTTGRNAPSRSASCVDLSSRSGSTADATPLVDIPAGTFTMGTDLARGCPEESPQRTITVEAFRLERHPVTNAQFARFVRETGYVTMAERLPDEAGLHGADPELLVPGGLVFTPTDGPVPLDDWRQWWRFMPGAYWHQPQGLGSTIAGLDDHPVVQVSHQDACAYADWCDRRLPTEAEYEYAARSGRPDTLYAWGDEVRPSDRLMANTWQGDFPYRNTRAHGWAGTSPVGSFPADPWGTVDLIGNVWEWTSTYYATGPARDDADQLASDVLAPEPDRVPRASAVTQPEGSATTCCGPGSRADVIRAISTMPGAPFPRRVAKGGSHLRAPEYCHRYRPPARQPQPEDSASTHLGFRCAV